MKLLAGLEAPDSGMASVGGFDVVADREVMRQNLGMCPQHDILYDELTNMEQLLLYLLRAIMIATYPHSS